MFLFFFFFLFIILESHLTVKFIKDCRILVFMMYNSFVISYCIL